VPVSSQSASRIVTSSRFGGREVGWITEDVAPEAEPVAVVGDRSRLVGDEQTAEIPVTVATPGCYGA